MLSGGTGVYFHTHMHTNTCTHARTRTHAHARTHTDTHTHTHTNTYNGKETHAYSEALTLTKKKSSLQHFLLMITSTPLLSFSPSTSVCCVPHPPETLLCRVYLLSALHFASLCKYVMCLYTTALWNHMFGLLPHKMMNTINNNWIIKASLSAAKCIQVVITNVCIIFPLKSFKLYAIKIIHIKKLFNEKSALKLKYDIQCHKRYEIKYI